MVRAVGHCDTFTHTSCGLPYPACPPVAGARRTGLRSACQPKTREAQAGCMWAWVLSGPCHLGHMVPSRVAGVAVGGRDLNWERNPLAEGRPGS